MQQGSTTLASYTYDTNGNRATMVTSAGTTTYTYDSADVLLVSKKDPTNKVTNYTYDSNGNLTKAVYDPGSSPHLNQTTTYEYDTNNRLMIEVDAPSGIVVTFTYDADGNRISKTVNGTTINDVYALGYLAEQTDSSGNILATFIYATSGAPASVVVGNPTSGTRYYYMYTGHGDALFLTLFGKGKSSKKTRPSHQEESTKLLLEDDLDGCTHGIMGSLAQASQAAFSLPTWTSAEDARLDGGGHGPVWQRHPTTDGRGLIRHRLGHDAQYRTALSSVCRQ